MDRFHNSDLYPSARLRLQSKDIRVLSILPGQFLDPLSCVLETVSLDENPKYDALSYAWGDPLVRVPIILNGSSYHVTINLQAALRRLRHQSATRHIWADAVCINQIDDDERTHQVNLMAQIYSRAQEVFLWLGDFIESPLEETEDVGTLFSTEYLFTDVSATTPLNISPPGAAVAPAVNAALNRSEVVHALALISKLSTNQHWDFLRNNPRPRYVSIAFEALNTLMDASWWNRMWTCQEAVLPAEATVVYGSLHIPLVVFSNASQACYNHCNKCCSVDPAECLTVQKFTAKTDPVHFFRKARHRGSPIMLTRLLEQLRFKSCSDPRDKVFALLGLATDQLGTTRVLADYSLPVCDVYTSVVIQLIQGKGGLSALLRERELSRPHNLPTWVPDWAAEIDIGHIAAYRTTADGYNLCRSGKLTEVSFSWSNTSPVLGLKGLYFDDVAILGQSILDPSPLGKKSVVQKWRSLLNLEQDRSSTYVGGLTYEEAFWRLLVLDQVLYQPSPSERVRTRRATSDDYKDFLQRFPQEGFNFNAMYQLHVLRFFITGRGFMGLGPKDMQVGDKVYVLFGGNFPFVLRPSPLGSERTSPRYTYVGHCHIQGIMDGEAVDAADESQHGWVYLV